MDVISSSIPKIAKMLRDGKISCRELTDIYLKRIKKNVSLNAFITVTEEDAVVSAENIDKEGFKSSDALLKGIPVALKDNFLVQGVKATCASKMLENYTATYDSTVTNKLKSKGVVILGKTNMDEFAMGSSNENSYFGPVVNPWDKKRVAGGSSGGSAVAVSAGLSHISYGTDTGGSVRLPASYNGILGLKPTYGRISRYGIISLASSLDQVGPMARNVEDLAIAYDAVIGVDKKDATTSKGPSQGVHEHLNDNIAKKCIGIPRHLIEEGVDADVAKSMDETMNLLKELGFKFKDIELPHSKYALDVYYIINPGEASSNLSRYDGVRYGFRSKDHNDLDSLYKLSRGTGFGEEVKRRIMLGTFVLSAGYYDAYFAKAAKVRTLIKQDFEKAFKECDVILLPTAPTTAFKIGEKTDDPLTMYMNDILVSPVNLAAVPALTFPSGVSSKGMPIGMQFIGKHFDEGTLFSATWMVQNERPEWFNRVSVK